MKNGRCYCRRRSKIIFFKSLTTKTHCQIPCFYHKMHNSAIFCHTLTGCRWPAPLYRTYTLSHIIITYLPSTVPKSQSQSRKTFRVSTDFNAIIYIYVLLFLTKHIQKSVGHTLPIYIYCVAILSDIHLLNI